jgi:hypothetical protein
LNILSSTNTISISIESNSIIIEDVLGLFWFVSLLIFYTQNIETLNW